MSFRTNQSNVPIVGSSLHSLLEKKSYVHLMAC